MSCLRRDWFESGSRPRRRGTFSCVAKKKYPKRRLPPEAGSLSRLPCVARCTRARPTGHPWPDGLVPTSCRHPSGYFLLQLRYSAAPTGPNNIWKMCLFSFPLVKPSTEGGEDKARRGAAGMPRVRHQHRVVLLTNPRADRGAQGTRDSGRRLGVAFSLGTFFWPRKRKYPAAGLPPALKYRRQRRHQAPLL